MTENFGHVTIFGENEEDEFEQKVTNHDSPWHYNDLFQLFKHLIEGYIL